MHIIHFWNGDWVKQMEKMNEAVGMKNCVMIGGGGKRMVSPFRGQDFWICIGCVLSAVNYGKKGNNILNELTKYFGKKATTKLQKYVHGNTNFYKMCCDIYHSFYIYACH